MILKGHFLSQASIMLSIEINLLAKYCHQCEYQEILLYQNQNHSFPISQFGIMKNQLIAQNTNLLFCTPRLYQNC